MTTGACVGRHQRIDFSFLVRVRRISKCPSCAVGSEEYISAEVNSDLWNVCACTACDPYLRKQIISQKMTNIVIFRRRRIKSGSSTSSEFHFQKYGSFSFNKSWRWRTEHSITEHRLKNTVLEHINSRPPYCFARVVTPREQTETLFGPVTTVNYLTPFVCWIESLTPGYWR